jgi:hypothetical protein
MPFGNTLDIFYLSFLLLHAPQWASPFPNGFFILVLPKTINYNVFFFFPTKFTKLVEPQTLKGDKILNNKSLVCDVQNKELPNVPKRSIQIKMDTRTYDP